MRSAKEKVTGSRDRRSFLKRMSLLMAAWPMAGYLRSAADDQSQPELACLLQTTERPTWLREGVVGCWHMENLDFYIRRGFVSYFEGGEAGPADVTFLWKEAFKEATAKHYKEMGINLVIMPLYKGAGLKAEAASIEATRKFTENAHRYGVKVGGYVGSTMMYETFYSEEPEARNWEQVDERGRPIYYSDQTFRHAACRNNPGYRAFIQKVLRVGIQDLKLDLILFDQLQWWPEPWSCHCKYCQEGFRTFLRKRYTDEQLKARLGHTNLAGIRVPDFNIGGPFMTEGGLPPMPLKDPLQQEWARFRCASLAEWWGETHAYIRKLNPEVALLGNPSANAALNSGFIDGVDFQQLFPHCESVFSEEENDPRWTSDERLVSRIRSYKVARAMGRSLTFWERGANKQGVYEPPYDEPSVVLGVAETLAYNDANLGWWCTEWGEEPPPRARQYISFFRSHIKDLIDTTLVTDVAILRSFASIEFNPAKSNVSTVLFEQTLIQHKFPFGIIFDTHLQDLSKYKVLVLANQDALSDEQIGQIRRFVEAGGGLVATEETSMLTEWRRKRDKFGLADVLGLEAPPVAAKARNPIRREFGKGRVVYIPRIEPEVAPPPAMMSYDFSKQYWKLPKNYADLVAAVEWAAGGTLSATVDGPLWVTMELAEQKSSNTRLLHLVNFKVQEPVKDISVKIRIPAGFQLREAVWGTPDDDSLQALSPTVREGVASFRVPQVDIYGLVLLRLEKK
jgi:hypothetical protein